jgi:hypothetical protein
MYAPVTGHRSCALGGSQAVRVSLADAHACCACAHACLCAYYGKVRTHWTTCTLRTTLADAHMCCLCACVLYVHGCMSMHLSGQSVHKVHARLAACKVRAVGLLMRMRVMLVHVPICVRDVLHAARASYMYGLHMQYLLCVRARGRAWVGTVLVRLTVCRLHMLSLLVRMHYPLVHVSGRLRACVLCF